MKRLMRTLAVGGLVAALAGCEGSVLVNNHPPKEPDYNAPAASSTTQPSASANTSFSDNAQTSSASIAPSTQPADQTVQTKNTRIESSSQ